MGCFVKVCQIICLTSSELLISFMEKFLEPRSGIVNWSPVRWRLALPYLLYLHYFTLFCNPHHRWNVVIFVAEFRQSACFVSFSYGCR
jgi:hypothetical protein